MRLPLAVGESWRVLAIPEPELSREISQASMIGLMEPDDGAVAAQLKGVSAALRGKLPELCQAVTDSILAQIEQLSQDQAIIDLLTVSVESNVTTLVHIIGYQIDSHQADAPPAAIAYARRLALKCPGLSGQSIH